VTFNDWYMDSIVPYLYTEQAPYEQESVAFKAIDKMNRQEIIDLFSTMNESTLKLALFDHVKSCMREEWVPNQEAEEFEEKA
jgi:hypothetical protein